MSSWTMTSGRQRSTSAATPAAIAGAMPLQKTCGIEMRTRSLAGIAEMSGSPANISPIVAGPIGSPRDDDVVAAIPCRPSDGAHGQQVADARRGRDEDPHPRMVAHPGHGALTLDAPRS